MSDDFALTHLDEVRRRRPPRPVDQDRDEALARSGAKVVNGLRAAARCSCLVDPYGRGMSDSPRKNRWLCPLCRHYNPPEVSRCETCGPLREAL